MSAGPSNPGQICLPGQHAAPEGPVDLANMYLMHHAFRRDLLAFCDVVAQAPIENRRRWRSLRQRWQRFASYLHHHHTAEDAGLWPLLLDRALAAGDDDARAVLIAMQDEHAAIDPLLAKCAAGFDRLAEAGVEGVRALLRVSLDKTWRLLDAHLGHEERDAMAIVQRYLTELDRLRVERKHFQRAYPIRSLPHLVPWSQAGLPSEVSARAIAEGGLPIRIILRLGQGSFDRGETAAFGRGYRSPTGRLRANCSNRSTSSG